MFSLGSRLLCKPSTVYNSCQRRSFSTHSGSFVTDHRKGAKIGEVVLTTKHGYDLLLDPLFHKGTGYPIEERERLGVRGLVPPCVFPTKEALKMQMKRVMTRFFQCESPLQKYSYISGLQDRNEVLFYRCLIEFIEEIAPIIYTPTVGLACQSYSNIFRRPRGMYFSANDRGCMHAMVYNWPSDDVEIIVVTDGSRILGLGDLGVNGMGIPVGKLALYSAGAGIHPSRTLPIMLDVGTNNPELLNDSIYLGLAQPRLTGAAYDEVVDEFIQAVKERWPKALIQFEDFSNENASRLLHKYRHQILCFNDDIQGTGCVALAGIFNALRLAGHKNYKKALCEQNFVICGAGSAGLGVASQICYAMVQAGLSEEEALRRFWLVDAKGLLGAERQQFTPLQSKWIRRDFKDGLSIEEVVKMSKATALIGLTGVGGLWDESTIRQLGTNCVRPIVFPLSNPTSKAECTAVQAYEWTDGRAIVASGSPFVQHEHNGKVLIPGQANNMYTYPSLGLGSILSQAKMVSDGMLYAASCALSEYMTDDRIEAGRIFPRVREIRKVTEHVTAAILRQTLKEGINQSAIPIFDEDLRRLVHNRMWIPDYGTLVRVDSIPSRS